MDVLKQAQTQQNPFVRSICKQSFFYLLIFLFVGCDAHVTDFVKGTKPSNITTPPATTTVLGNTPFKVSPGQVSASSANASVVGHVTSTQRTLTSANASATVSISRARSSQ